MKIFTLLVAAATLASPLFIGSAHAFSTVTMDGSAVGTSSAFGSSGKALSDDNNPPSSSGYSHKEGNFSFGFNMQGSGAPGFGNGMPAAPMMGQGLTDSGSPPKPFESYIPRP